MHASKLSKRQLKASLHLFFSIVLLPQAETQAPFLPGPQAAAPVERRLTDCSGLLLLVISWNVTMPSLQQESTFCQERVPGCPGVSEGWPPSVTAIRLSADPAIMAAACGYHHRLPVCHAQSHVPSATVSLLGRSCTCTFRTCVGACGLWICCTATAL